MPSTDVIAAGFKGTAFRMVPGMVADLAREHRYETAVLEAILDVESGGAGFDDQGRPKILPELHVFYRELGPGPKRDAVVRAGLAYLKQGTRPYLVGSEANYARLKQMCAYDLEAALRSTSFGIGQVMGFNFKACGYTDVRDFVAAAMGSELAQFEMVLSYLESAGLAAAIRAKDWDRIAEVYNGPGNKLVYAARLRAAYAVHSKAPSRPAIAPAGGPVLRLVSSTPALRQAPVTADSLNDAQYLLIRSGLAA